MIPFSFRAILTQLIGDSTVSDRTCIGNPLADGLAIIIIVDISKAGSQTQSTLACLLKSSCKLMSLYMSLTHRRAMFELLVFLTPFGELE